MGTANSSSRGFTWTNTSLRGHQQTIRHSFSLPLLQPCRTVQNSERIPTYDNANVYSLWQLRTVFLSPRQCNTPITHTHISNSTLQLFVRVFSLKQKHTCWTVAELCNLAVVLMHSAAWNDCGITFQTRWLTWSFSSLKESGCSRDLHETVFVSSN